MSMLDNCPPAEAIPLLKILWWVLYHTPAPPHTHTHKVRFLVMNQNTSMVLGKEDIRVPSHPQAQNIEHETW